MPTASCLSPADKPRMLSQPPRAFFSANVSKPGKYNAAASFVNNFGLMNIWPGAPPIRTTLCVSTFELPAAQSKNSSRKKDKTCDRWRSAFPPFFSSTPQRSVALTELYALNYQLSTINFFGTPPRSPSPSTQPPYRRALPESRYVSSRSSASRHASVSRQAQTR